MRNSAFKRLLAFLDRLDEARVPYSIRRSRDDAIMVVAFALDEYWEMDFTESGEVEVERFCSNGVIEGESALKKLFALWSEEESPAKQSVKANDSVA